VQVIDSGVDRAVGSPFMVMELLKGQDVQQLLERVGPLPVEPALRVVAQACVGLQKAAPAAATPAAKPKGGLDRDFDK